MLIVSNPKPSCLLKGGLVFLEGLEQVLKIIKYIRNCQYVYMTILNHYNRSTFIHIMYGDLGDI
jgi:hypothetical protein